MPGFRTAVVTDQDVDILVRGPVTTQDIAYAQHAIGRLVTTSTDIDHVTIKLAAYAGDRDPVTVAQVNLELSGRLVRAQATAGTARQAMDRTAAALAPRIHRLRRRLSPSQAGPPSFTDEPWDSRAARMIAPAGRVGGRARRIARQKAYPLAVQGFDAATFTMDLRDYDFHLFVDEVSGQDAVVLRGGAGGYRLAVDRPELLAPEPSGVPTADAAQVLPRHTLPEAVGELDRSPSAFLAFTNDGSDRASVLYRRFDGDLALLTSLW